MKKYFYLLISLFFLTMTANGQVKMKVWQGGASTEFNVANVDSVTFAVEDVSEPSVQSTVVTNVQKDLAYISVTYAGAVSEAKEFGLVYSTVNDFLAKADTVKISIVNADKTCSFKLDLLSPNTTYYYYAYVTDSEGQTHNGVGLSFTTLSKFPIAEMVDLGLSVKWASWNIGASSSTDFGLYMGWGDPTGENQSYAESSYPNDLSDISGSSEDVAHVQWGDKWRMPTEQEWRELLALKKESVEVNGVTCWKVTGANGNYIYLPKGGYSKDTGMYMLNQRAYYWTSVNVSTPYAKYVTIAAVTDEYGSLNKGYHILVRPVYGGSSVVDPNPQDDVTPIDTTAAGKAAQSVDLGLSVRWATYNIGATNSTDNGSYFAWGETERKADYSRSTYKFYDADNDEFNLSALGTNISGTDYDAARALWGGTWRMPTEAEFDELINKCTWTASATGYTVKGPNGNSIFLPYAGTYSGSSLSSAGTQGQYWSGNYQTGTLYANDHFGVRLNINATTKTTSSGNYVYKGLPIRPVRK